MVRGSVKAERWEMGLRNRAALAAKAG